MRHCPPVDRQRRALLLSLGAASLGGACTTVRLDDPTPSTLLDAGELAFLPASVTGEDYAGGDTLRAAVTRLHALAWRLRMHPPAGVAAEAPAHGLVLLDADLRAALRVAPVDDGESLLEVADVIDGSPATQAGLARGDLVERVDGQAAAPDDPLRRRLLARLADPAAEAALGVRRGPQRLAIRLRAGRSAALTPVLGSDRFFVWQGDTLPLATVDDALLAFAIAHQAAMRREVGRTRAVVDGGAGGEVVDGGLSALSLLLGIATLGGWSAKPVDVFDERAAAGRRAQARTTLWRDAVLAADRSAFEWIRSAGFDVAALLRDWPLHAERAEDASGSPRLQALRALAAR